MKRPRRDLPWSVPVALHEVPETGRRFDLIADPQTRDAIAVVAGLRSLPQLKAAFDLTRHGRNGLRVAGRISATVGQTCVVTLEPIESTVEEDVDLVFTPSSIPAEIGDDEGPRPAAMAADDAPEPLVGDAVDLGAIATEFLMLGIDPYPRKEGATFEALSDTDEGSHPFAALAALKKARGER